jgi:hypothetical protein
MNEPEPTIAGLCEQIKALCEAMRGTAAQMRQARADLYGLTVEDLLAIDKLEEQTRHSNALVHPKDN